MPPSFSVFILGYHCSMSSFVMFFIVLHISVYSTQLMHFLLHDHSYHQNQRCLPLFRVISQVDLPENIIFGFDENLTVVQWFDYVSMCSVAITDE